MPEAPIAPERLSRILALLGYLLDERRGDQVPVLDIERDLGLERRAVEEDLSVLNLVNFGGGNYVIYAWLEGDRVQIDRQLVSDPLTRPARLSPLTARALLLALELVGEAFTGEGLAPVASVRAKVEEAMAGLPAPGSVDLVDLTRADRAVVQALNQAVRENRLVRLTYYTPLRGELGTRLVEPYLLFHTGSAWYLEAYCLTAEGERTFRLDRIREAEVTEEVFRPRSELAARRGVEESLDVETAARHALVRFPASRRQQVEEQGFPVTGEQDDTLLARIPYLDERWLVREVLRHGGAAVVEEPPEAREAVRLAAERLRDRYRNPPPETEEVL